MDMKKYRGWYPRYQQVLVAERHDWCPVALAAIVVWLGVLTVVVAIALR